MTLSSPQREIIRTARKNTVSERKKQARHHQTQRSGQQGGRLQPTAARGCRLRSVSAGSGKIAGSTDQLHSDRGNPDLPGRTAGLPTARPDAQSAALWSHGHGKTRLVEKFLRDQPSPFDEITGLTRLPVACIQMPPSPNEREFYEELLVGLRTVLSAGLSGTALRHCARAGPQLDVRMLASRLIPSVRHDAAHLHGRKEQVAGNFLVDPLARALKTARLLS